MSVEEEIKRLEDKQKLLNFQIEKRLVALEHGLENINVAFSSGALSEEQEKRVNNVEERLETIEDQLMMISIDVIKMKEEIHSEIPAEGSKGIKDILIHNRRLNEIESMVKDIESRIAKSHVKSGGNDSIRKDFESFKAETEENIEIIVDSIKKILSKMK